MNEYQRALRDFQDHAEDVSRARYLNMKDALRRLASTLVPTTPLGDVVEQLPKVDFDSWYKAQLGTGGAMVGTASINWPDGRDQRLAMQVELIRRLASDRVDLMEFTYTFTYVGNSFNNNTAEFVQQIFRPFVRDFLRFAHDSPMFEAGLNERRSDPLPNPESLDELSLFISHSGQDAAIAKALITLFEKALKISARKIRCTSVDGYRLPAGADTNEVLRTEVFGAKLFIALLTPTSLASPYVLFELGARWGARRKLFPVLAGGATAADLRAPLNGLNALSASVPDQVRQLVEDASEALSEALEPMSSFSAEIEGLVSASYNKES
jgi:hypothetical protein